MNTNSKNLILQQYKYWRLEDVKFHQMSVTSYPLPYHSPLEGYKTFLFFFILFYWNYTRNYTRNYVSPPAIFKKPQVHDPETLTADKKLLGAAVLLTSHLFCTPSALEATPSSSPPSVSLYDGACTPQASAMRVSLLLSSSSNIPCWVDSSLAGLQAAGSRPVSLTKCTYLLLL